MVDNTASDRKMHANDQARNGRSGGYFANVQKSMLAMLDVGSAILLLAGLSFLGLGAVPPTPEWGSMISGAVQYFDQWWLAVAPGLAIVSVVLAFNIIGDAIRDNLEPKLKESGGAS